ncbi:tRNA delta(2)-isopentenylpyrophosphate transferase [Nonlabens sp. YIK11]|uniref:tRNA (adenosine(37)-N6)-dimethylallyltransferase MiaA n=1 Tax=Nonlabens sp. YIK11 TaxID=1453349 RepID=UPI0006DC2E6E|nr:tRNA (adenosine(37)-N6)-dimethylallyltransferase MiaA [Nonlabens sp. YIK11]KQC33248.1 tRNA delta(2)-isopentenylpyrophosphate transferase [Nonlabens sp. YIK11]
MSTKKLITIIGPTAVGKTALSIAFAKAYKTNIISCDSRQFFKEMTIGTAVPEPEELAAAPHHFIQNLSIHDSYSVGDFERDALSTLADLFATNDVVIMVGGSALYEKAVTHGLDEFPDVPDEVIDTLNKELEQDGLEKLVTELKEIDPEYALTADLENPRRVIRALSVYRESGETYSSFLGRKNTERDFEIIKIGLEAPRPTLYDRINRRVDVMLENGLLEEAKELLLYKDLTPLKTVGYQELFPYFEGDYDLDEAIRLIKRNSRRFAKRQMTWYRKDPEVHWFSYNTSHTEIVRRVEE